MNKSKIEWCDHTWNPVTGCRNGCSYCYANTMVKRFSGDARLNKMDKGSYLLVEAADGGEIGLLRDGDIIHIDIPNYSIHADVSDTEWEERRKSWTPKEPAIKTGWLKRYARLVESANKGAVLK